MQFRFLLARSLKRAQSGNALFFSLILTFLFLSVILGLVTTTQVNNRGVTASLDQTRARFAAVSGFNIAKFQIDEALINETISLAQAGNCQGIARSLEEPGQNIQGAPPNLGSIEETVSQVAFATPGSALPSPEATQGLPDGFFSARATQLPDGSFRVRVYGKWRQSSVRLNALVVPPEGTPFKLGIYGRSGVVVNGPGKIDWINSDDPDDNETPVVLESGNNLTVDKDPR